jgi:putative hydrolase of the HAD superfamily
MYSRIRHIFFDLDHTLWDFETNSRAALEEMFVNHGIDAKCNTAFSEFLQTYEGINHRYWELYSAKQVSKDELRYRRFHDAFMHYGYDNVELARHWADEYLHLSPYKTNLMPGAIEVLEYLKPRYTLHLITNGFKEVQDIKIDCSKLRSYFHTILISEEHGLSKPDPQIFRLAETLSGARMEECVMIGDNIDMDVHGAQQAGWQAIHLTPTTMTYNAAEIRGIAQLAELRSFF